MHARTPAAAIALLSLFAIQFTTAEMIRARRSHEHEGDEDYDGSGRLEVTPTIESSPIPLHFQFFTTPDDLNGGLYYSKTSILALKLAVEHVNANSTILSGYNLTYDVKELECSKEDVTDLFFQDVFSQYSIIAFLASACPQTIKPIAKLVHRWNITEIVSSPFEPVTVEGHSTTTPNLLRLYPLDSSIVPALHSLVRHYQWKRLLVISGIEDKFQSVITNIDQSFSPSNVSVAHRQILSDSDILGVPDLLGEAEDYRIVFLNVNPTTARTILCEAYRRGHIYPYYSWILYGWYDIGWWKKYSKVEKNTIDGNCTDDEIVSILDNSISLHLDTKPLEKDIPTDIGISYNQFHREYSQLLKEYSSDDETDLDSLYHSSLTYDTVWTLAMALHFIDTVQSDHNASTEECGELDKYYNFNLGAFNYSNYYLGCRIRQELLKTNIIGISGLVMFSENGIRRISDIAIMQYRKFGFLIEFAEFNLDTEELVYSPGESDATTFPDGITPDGTPKNETVTFFMALTATYYAITTIGIVFCLVCLAFNITYRKARVVKLTSPTINYILILGAAIMFFSVYIRLLPHTGETVNTIRCNVQPSINTVAYCLGYGAILTKMGRVYQIFINPSPNKNKICMKDWHMVLIVLFVTGIGVVLLVVRTAFFRTKAFLVPSVEWRSGKDDLGITINYHTWQCYSQERDAPFYSLFFIHGYILIFQLFSLILAIKTRKIKVSALNDSKYITAIVYVSSLVVAMIVLLNFVSGEFQNLHEAFFSTGIFLATYSLLGFTFIPKMVIYYRDPKGDHLLQDLSGLQLQIKNLTATPTPNQERIATLEKRVSELESLLQQYKDLKRSESLVVEDSIAVAGITIHPSTTLFENHHVDSTDENIRTRSNSSQFQERSYNSAGSESLKLIKRVSFASLEQHDSDHLDQLT